MLGGGKGGNGVKAAAGGSGWDGGGLRVGSAAGGAELKPMRKGGCWAEVFGGCTGMGASAVGKFGNAVCSVGWTGCPAAGSTTTAEGPRLAVGGLPVSGLP